VPDGEVPVEGGEAALVEDLCHEAHVFDDGDVVAVAARDPCGFLAAVLEGPEPEVGEVRRPLPRGEDPHHATGLANLGAVVGMGLAVGLVGLTDRGEPSAVGHTGHRRWWGGAEPSRTIGPMQRDTGFCLWFTGLSGAGKSTIANIVVDELIRRDHLVELLDGDEVREHLSKGLTFSKEDRDINVRRIGWVAKVLARNGVVSVTAAISPYRAIRDEVRATMPNFVEIHVATPVEVCEARDVKGLYAKARAGEIPQFTGLDDPYEAPLQPEIRVETDGRTPEESAAEVVAWLEAKGLAKPA
jgi:adenylylsulfate kinase